jgi:hypothetical protein
MKSINQNDKSIDESVRLAMDQAWRDHHHARDQTWKAVQMVAVLLVGLITIEFKYHNLIATSIAGLIVIVATISAILIANNHRKLERRKFIHIMNCESYLKLHELNIIPLNKEGEYCKYFNDMNLKMMI